MMTADKWAGMTASDQWEAYQEAIDRLAALEENGKKLAQTYVDDTRGLREQIVALDQRLAAAEAADDLHVAEAIHRLRTQCVEHWNAYYMDGNVDDEIGDAQADVATVLREIKRLRKLSEPVAATDAEERFYREAEKRLQLPDVTADPDVFTRHDT